jgi:hypothetical protein
MYDVENLSRERVEQNVALELMSGKSLTVIPHFSRRFALTFYASPSKSIRYHHRRARALVGTSSERALFLRPPQSEVELIVS